MYLQMLSHSTLHYLIVMIYLGYLLYLKKILKIYMLYTSRWVEYDEGFLCERYPTPPILATGEGGNKGIHIPIVLGMPVGNNQIMAQYLWEILNALRDEVSVNVTNLIMRYMS